MEILTVIDIGPTTKEPDSSRSRSKSRRGSLSTYEINKALRVLGFCTWKDLEPGKLNYWNFSCIELHV